jgi:hypothetical protein
MRTYLTILTSLFIIVSGCNENIIQPDDEGFSGKLEIKTDKSEYYPEDFNGDFAFVSATIVNTSTDTFYSSLGDFYGGIDQDNLFMAAGNDCYFEVSSKKNSWEELSRPIAIEGSKVIRILPSKAYKLTATTFLDSSNFGRCRLRINFYRTHLKIGVDTLKDISNNFFVYK